VAEHARADQRTELAGAPSALIRWNAIVQALLDRGYSSLNAFETAHKAYPGLWLEAVAESAAPALRAKAGR